MLVFASTRHRSFATGHPGTIPALSIAQCLSGAHIRASRCRFFRFTAQSAGFGTVPGSNIADSSPQQQVQSDAPLLLPSLGGGRVARSEQLRRRALQKIKAQGSKRRATVNVAKLLTNQIAAATSLEQLHDIVAVHGGHLDHIHVAKLLSRTSQLSLSAVQQHQKAAASIAPEQHQADQQAQLHQQKQHELQQLLYGTLTSMLVQRLRHATAQSLVPAVAAIGRMAALRHHAAGSSMTAPTRDELSLLASKALELMPKLSISQTAVVLWGLAKAGYKPSSSKLSSSNSGSWLDVMLAATLQQYNLAHERQQQRQQRATAASDARLHRPVHPAANKQQQEQWPILPQLPCQAHPHQHSLATDLALVLYAVAVMGQQPDSGWLLQCQAAVLQQLPEANAQDLSQVLLSVSSLGVRPDSAWLHQVLVAAQPMLHSAGSQALSNTLWSLSRFSQQPSQDWWQDCLQAVYADQTLVANPPAFSSCLASLARMKAPVEPNKLNHMLEKTVGHLTAFNPWQLTNTVWACASMNVKPSQAWTKQFLRSVAHLADAGKFGASQLASILWSLALLHRSGQDLLASQQLQLQILLNAIAAAHDGTGLQHIGAGGRSGVAWALATLGMAPSRLWLGQYLSVAFEGGLASDQVRCANVLFCIASLDFDFLVEWLEGFLAGGGTAASAGSLDLSLEKYAALVNVLEALSAMDSKQLRAAWLDISNTEWSSEVAAGDGVMGFSMQLPPSLSSWVDSMLAAPAAAVLRSPAGNTSAASG